MRMVANLRAGEALGALRSPGMAMNLQQISDHIEINDVLSRYARAVDTLDWDLLTTCFTEDATVDYSASHAPVGPFTEFREWMAQTMPGFGATQHFVTNAHIVVDGDQATSRAYFWNP